MKELDFISTHLRNLVYLKTNTNFCGQAQKPKKYLLRLTQTVQANCCPKITIMQDNNCSLLTKINTVIYVLSTTCPAVNVISPATCFV